MLRRAAVAVLFVVLMPATVQAFDHHHHHSGSGGDGGGGCGSSSKSDSSDTPSVSTPPSGTLQRVFVTSRRYSGALGSVKAVDTYCQQSATEHHIAGVFKAWISDASTNAYDRTADVGPWYTMHGDVAFASKADLRAAPRTDLLDEGGNRPTGLGTTGAWSGSSPNGGATGHDCDGWTNASADATATMGSALGLDTAWGGDDVPSKCNALAPLICFQQ